MMDGLGDKERKEVERERERERRSGAAPVGDSGLLCFSSQPGSLLAKVQAVSLSPNEGARQLLDMLGSH